jgi:hypothetical protein
MDGPQSVPREVPADSGDDALDGTAHLGLAPRRGVDALVPVTLEQRR